MTTRLAVVLAERLERLAAALECRISTLADNRQCFPITAANRFTGRVSINAPIRIHLRNFCLREWALFTVSYFQVKGSHCLLNDL